MDDGKKVDILRDTSVRLLVPQTPPSTTTTMAADHVDGTKNKNTTVFSLFNRLIKSNNKREKSCAALIDFWKWSEENVGSSSAEQYSTKRIVRGLAANEIERQNTFFAALCTVLECGGVSTNSVVSSLKSVIESIGSSKSEHTTVIVTSVLTYGALIKTRKFHELDTEEQIEAIGLLISSCNSRSYVKTASCVFLVNYLQQVGKTDFKTVFLPVVKGEIEAQKEVQHDFLAVTGVAYFRFPKMMQKLVDAFFGGRFQLLEDVSQRVLNCPVVQEDVLKLLCVELAASGPQLVKLWKTLLKTEPKNVLKWYAYVLLIAKILIDVVPNTGTVVQLLDNDFIDVIFKSMQNHDKQSKSEVYYVRAKQVLESLVTRLSASECNLEAIKVVLAHPTGLQFDRKTKSSAVQTLIASLSAGNLAKLGDELVAMLEAGWKNQERPKSPKEMELLLTMLVKIPNHPEVKKNVAAYATYSKIVFDYAFLKSIRVNSEFRSKAADLFFRTLDNHLKIEDGVVLLNGLVQYAHENLDNLVIDLKDEDKKQWGSMLTTDKKLSMKSDKKFVALRLLLLHMGLLMFRDQDLASSTIEELLQCYQRLKKKQKTDEEPHWVEVTVDLLLAMLSRDNKLLRHVVGSVFPSIVPDLTGTALQQVVDALDPGAKNDVLKHAESDDSDDDSDGDDEEDEEESAGSDVDGEEETVNDKLRMAVRNALGYSAALTDDESVDMDNMNEEEEQRLNESLSNAFKLFRPNKGSNKKKQSKDDEALTHFRVRVLDLVEIVVGASPSLASCLELINPLIGLLEFAIKDPHQKPLQNRLESVLRKLGAVKKFANVLDVSYSDLVAMFKSLFERETSGMVYVEMAASVTEVAGLLVRASQLVDKNGDESFEDVFGQLLDRFFKTNDRKIPFAVFQSVLRILWDGNWIISKRIMSLLLEPDLKLFKKLKCLELLELFYRNDRLQSTATDDCKKEASSFEAKFVKKFAKTLGDYDPKRSKLLPTFLARLLPFIQMAMQSRARYRGNCSPAPAWDLVVKHLLDNVHILPLPKIKNKLVFLAQQCKLPVPDFKAKKQQVEESDDETVTETVTEDQEKAKKRKFRPESKKLKKESRDLREAASSQGLGMVSFAGVNLDALDNEDDSEDDGPPEQKKTKKDKKKKK